MDRVVRSLPMPTDRILRRRPRRASPRAVAACAAVAALSGRGSAQNQGAWAPAFDHEVNTANTNHLTIPITYLWPPKFNAIHMALIPVGPHRGKVLVWDKAEVALRPYQRWSIIDPTWSLGSGQWHFRNFFLQMPAAAQSGDLFCAGHVWLRDGRLFVAGGTATYPSAPNGYFGASLCYQWAPDLFDSGNLDYGVWQREPDMGTTRWYPSVTLRDDDSLLIAGGSDNGVYHNDYEVYRLNGAFGQTPPAAMTFDQRSSGGGNLRLYAGPNWPGSFPDYPRVHLLTTGELFCSGWYRRGCKWQHVPSSQPVYDFSAGAGADLPAIVYASSIHDPRQGGADSRILRIGGNSNNLSITDVDSCVADQPGNWQLEPPASQLHYRRWMQNAVILPTAEVFVFGGFSDGQNPGVPEPRPELLTASGWVVQPAETGARGYHATAVLLPDGRVFCGGADTRSSDYQIYSPPYLTNGRPRPKGISCEIASVPGGMHYRCDDPQAAYTLWWDENLPSGVTVDQVVLIRPGSVTHHSDMDTRYLRLPIDRTDELSPRACQLRFRPPQDRRQMPRGWCMLFAISSEGVPAEAIWVHLE